MLLNGFVVMYVGRRLDVNLSLHGCSKSILELDKILVCVAYNLVAGVCLSILLKTAWCKKRLFYMLI